MLFVPDYTRKLSWAEQHLARLEQSMKAFADRHPYQVVKATSGPNTGKWVLEFMESPDPDWALMVGDVLYNLRASLDYLASALSPISARSKVLFPIVHEPVWERPTGSRGRRRWDTFTAAMQPEAVAIIKHLQPVPSADLAAGYLHRLDLLNGLRNQDSHNELHVYLSGLGGLIGVTTMLVTGRTLSTQSEPDLPPDLVGTAAIGQGSIIVPPIWVDPDDVVEVRVRGTVTQAISMGSDGRQAVMPQSLRLVVEWIRKEVVEPLTPYLYA